MVAMTCAYLACTIWGSCAAPSSDAVEPPILRVVELNAGEQQTVSLSNGETATIQLLQMRESRDRVMGAIRQVEVDVQVNGSTATLVSGLYRLPTLVGGVQIDCPVTINYNHDSHR